MTPTILGSTKARCWLSLHMAPLLMAMAVAIGGAAAADEAAELPRLTVKRCADFAVNGQGDAAAWQAAEWVEMRRRDKAAHDYESRFKILYSKTGVYVLFDATDKTLTSTMQEDFLDLWTEDVFECFFWPSEKLPLYFEYEISPLGYELPILIPNVEGRFLGWRPWHYEGKRKTRKQVSAQGGASQSMASVTGWRAEVFIPFELLNPLPNVPPQAGTEWRANFYRMDYDDNQTSAWEWAPVGPSFHEYQKFGRLVFE